MPALHGQVAGPDNVVHVMAVNEDDIGLAVMRCGRSFGLMGGMWGGMVSRYSQGTPTPRSPTCMWCMVALLRKRRRRRP